MARAAWSGPWIFSALHRPDVFNHNLETVEPLYRNVRPGADYHWSLRLLAGIQGAQPRRIPTKSGIMLGLGETREQVEQALRDLRAHDVDMVTTGPVPAAHRSPSPGDALLDAGRV